MGRIIDRTVITIAAAFILYTAFLGATDSIPAAVFMSFIAMCLLKKLCSVIPGENTARRRLRKARAILEQLSLSNKETAEAQLTQLISHATPETAEEVPLRFVLRHPSQKTTAEDVAQIYRSLPRCPSVRIISLAEADRQAFELASKLQNPQIILTAGDNLATLISKNPDIIPNDPNLFVPHHTESLPGRLFAAASRAKYVKCALTGLVMCLLFFLSGTLTYLIGSCILLFISAVSFRHRILSH